MTVIFANDGDDLRRRPRPKATVRVPKPWRPVLEKADAVTLLAMADWFDDRDRPDDAECVKWLVAKGRWPYRRYNGTFVWGFVNVSVTYHGEEKLSACLPQMLALRACGLRKHKLTLVDAFNRLLTAWSQSPAADRAVFWRWTPPPPPEAAGDA